MRRGGLTGTVPQGLRDLVVDDALDGVLKHFGAEIRLLPPGCHFVNGLCCRRFSLSAFSFAGRFPAGYRSFIPFCLFHRVFPRDRLVVGVKQPRSCCGPGGGDIRSGRIRAAAERLECAPGPFRESLSCGKVPPWSSKTGSGKGRCLFPAADCRMRSHYRFVYADAIRGGLKTLSDM